MKRTVAVIDPAKLSAVGYYRVHQPFSHLMRFSNKLEILPVGVPELKDMMYFDAIVLKRPNTQKELNIIQTAKYMGVKVVLDFDDNLYSVPPTNPYFPVIVQTIKFIDQAVKLADLIIFSTKGCEDHFKRHGNIPDGVVTVVAKNSVSGRIDGSAGIKHGGDSLGFAWRGGSSHSMDLEVGKPILTSIMNNEKLRMEFWGHCPPWMMGKGVKYRAWYSDLFAYQKALKEADLSWMIVPLNKDEFNDGKSNIAWLEATQARMNVLATVINDEWKERGIVKLNSGKSLQEMDLKNVVKMSRDQREELYQDSVKAINTYYTLDVVNDIRESAIVSLWE